MTSTQSSKEGRFTSLEEAEISKISIESTDEEQYGSDHEFIVERILAQKTEDGQTLYLIRWTGFPEEESSWEPRKNILGQSILDAWKRRRTRELQGLDAPYDVGKLELLKKVAEAGKARRACLRREKRKRQGIVVSPHESDADSVDETPTTIPHPLVNTATLRDARNSERQQQVQAARKSKIQERQQIDSDSSSDEPLFVTSRQKSTLGASSSTKTPAQENGASKVNASDDPLIATPESSSSSKNSSGPKGSSLSRGVSKIRGGGGATRGGSSLQSQNVFLGGKAPRKQKASLIEAAADPSKDQRHFKNRHILRKVELAGRTIADKSPDIAAIPGGLINPSKVLSSSVQRPDTLYRTPSAPQNEVPMELVESPLEKQQVSQRLPALHPSEMSWEEVQHIPYEKRTICFFFTQPSGCTDSSCKYLHKDDPLLPIAPPPDGWFGSQQICFFYNLNGDCRWGDTCSSLHESNPNIPVRKPPPGWVAPDPSIKTMPTKAQLPNSIDGPQSVCYYWFHDNSCTKGVDCKMAHSTDNDLRVAPRPGSVPCRYWIQGHCRNGADCSFTHEPTQDNRSVSYMSQLHPKVIDSESTREKSVQSSLHQSKPMPIFGDDDTMDFEMNIMPDLPPLESNIAEPEQCFDDHSAAETVKITGTKIKIVTFGPQTQPIKLDFTSLPLNTSDWARAFASAEILDFNQICTIHDFKSRYSHIQHSNYWQASINTDPADQAVRDTVTNMAKHLCLQMSGLACISSNYIILLYPTVAEEWKYLDATPDLPTDATLKYLVFGSQSPISSSMESATIDKISLTALSHSDMMMKSFHHLDYEKLTIDLKLKDQKLKKPITFNFCLIFPASKQRLAELIASWLKSCSKDDGKIYSYQKPGCWNHFKKHVNAGAVLIHSSALSLISDTDLIHGMTLDGMNYTFWCIQDSTSKVPFSQMQKQSELGQVITKRLLPLGYTILLTPSFLVAEPVMTLSFLQWYQKKLKSSISGSIRVLCCHELPSFLMELAISKAEEQQELMKRLAGDPSMLSKLSERGLSHEQCTARLDLYWLLCDILRRDLPANLSPFDRDPSEENSRSPFLFAPPLIDQNDEKKLVAWFAGWAYANLDNYRRFYVIGSGKSNRSFGVPVRMIPESESLPPNSKAFREGGALAWARRGRNPIPIACSTAPLGANENPLEKAGVKLKEFKYEFTDEWYPEWRRKPGEGRSSNHIIEYRWNRVFESLKIPFEPVKVNY
ncbi:putative chromo domain-containing protein [Botrytis fragariae]|uniref:Putative chromo domain-containing protein n=1 Tax=Botrytis fragariae TaxID=1964551 RepID=A0A8H6AVC2_9HELO|nr:putative chromo domain-containing protein [Botrytis fragariae]KAF5874258.1 putative chromo domain-containing protein [Botrytis fragariae]